MEFFFSIFVLLLVGCVVVEYASRRDSVGAQTKHVEGTAGFLRFQLVYLAIYLTNMGADWLQGPYIYALYEDYGFHKDDIALLFICGFLSSMIFGTFVGAVADKYGRKNMAILFGVFYSVSCITKLYNNFHILLIGRLLSGVATSLLFSVFEAWMVCEHNKRGYSTEGLSQTFSYATFGNGVVAIVMGLIASFVADHYGYVAPFMVSLAMLITGSVLVATMWTENHGDTTVDVAGTFTNAIAAIRADGKVAALGCMQSFFEASMYTFVFMWTPALQESSVNGEGLPFGVIFAAYMVSIMIGSSLFKILAVKYHMPAEQLAKYIFGVAAVALFIPVITSNRGLVMIGFITFELTCGMYWPCIGTMKGKYIPESSRAAIMNFYRIPVNFLVVVILVKVSMFKTSTVFMMCSIWLALALASQMKFVSLIENSPYREKRMQDQDQEAPLVTPSERESIMSDE